MNATTFFADEAKRLCAGLTQRQIDVLVLMCKGYARNDAAAMLGIGRTTLDFHMRGVHRVLEVGKTIEAAVIAAKAGLV